jgi:adenylate cyclase
VILLYSFWETTSLKSKIQKVFNLYVSEKITKRASIDNDTKFAEEKNVSMFFSDIQGFTSMSEKLSPQENIDILNEYFEIMSGEIIKKDGYIDKYI